jgi:hypothetical protein
MSWINVKDEMPRRDGVMHVTDGEHVTIAEWYEAGGWSLSREDKASGFSSDTITQWMPLPAPPKTTGGSQ